MPGFVSLDCILEHESRGFVVDLPGDRDEKFHFCWSKPRSTALLMTERKARAWLIHPACPAGTYILRYDYGSHQYKRI